MGSHCGIFYTTKITTFSTLTLPLSQIAVDERPRSYQSDILRKHYINIAGTMSIFIGTIIMNFPFLLPPSCAALLTNMIDCIIS